MILRIWEDNSKWFENLSNSLKITLGGYGLLYCFVFLWFGAFDIKQSIPVSDTSTLLLILYGSCHILFSNILLKKYLI